MEALASPSSCGLSSSSSASSIALEREKSWFVTRLENCSSRTRKASGFGPIFVQQSKPISPVFCLSPKTQVEFGQVHVQTEEKHQSETKTVHVKFQLEKECSFGEQFLMVGNDTMLGLWEPEHAVPLTWSDQHVWFAELDIPVGKLIQYKFILQDGTGNILWQPGTDRVFEAWETENMIIVSDDWENPEIHVVSEEEKNLSSNDNPVLVFDSDVKAFTDGIPPSQEKPKTGVESSGPEITNQKRVSSSSETSATVSKTDSVSAEEALGNNGRAAAIGLVNYKGEPVLVPGLPPLPEFSAEENKDDEIGEKISLNDSVEALEAKDHSSAESTHSDQKKDSQNNQPPKGKTDEKTKDQEHKLERETQQKPDLGKTEDKAESEPKDESDILLNDLQWSQKTLQNFLTNFRLF